MIKQIFTSAILAIGLAAPFAAAAEEPREPRRTRVGLGPQLVPAFPGSDRFNVIPLIEYSSTRGDEPFAFEAPDESFGFTLLRSGGLELGPVASLEGSRTARDVGAPLDKVDTTIEVGGFVQHLVSPSFRVRGELRKGIGGHEGLIGMAGADFITRDGDKYLFSIGPRVTFSDRRYQRAYFGVTPAEAARSGLPAFAPGRGAQALGATAGLLTQLGGRWGLYGYAKYDRLIGDAGRSPIVRRLGSRDQVSGGLALTYTFGRR